MAILSEMYLWTRKNQLKLIRFRVHLQEFLHHYKMGHFSQFGLCVWKKMIEYS